jgi:hypothetical protein
MLRNRVWQRAFERLERLEGKLSRAVLRGREASNGLLLPDQFEERQFELSRFGYWSKIDKFDRRTANKRLKQYAAKDVSWREFEEVTW